MVPYFEFKAEIWEQWDLRTATVISRRENLEILDVPASLQPGEVAHSSLFSENVPCFLGDSEKNSAL